MTILADGAFAGIKPNERDSSPAGWVRSTLVPDIDWKYHHIIPWEMLRDTWQGLLMCQGWKELAFYVEAVGVQRSLVNRLMSRAMTYQDREDLFARLSWPAWNIVEGPADREDEGGTELDIFHHGLIGIETLQMTEINKLHQAMSAFLQHFDRSAMMQARNSNVSAQASTYDPQRGAPENVSSSRDLLMKALRSMTSYKTSRFIPYREDMWMTAVAGRVDSKIAVWTRKPRFKKSNGAARSPPIHSVPQIGLTECGKCRSKFNAAKAKAGGAPGMKLCPKCGFNVYTPKSAFHDPGFTVCKYCRKHYETPFGPAPCPKCYLPQ